MNALSANFRFLNGSKEKNIKEEMKDMKEITQKVLTNIDLEKRF